MVQYTGPPGKTSQPATNRIKATGSNSERRSGRKVPGLVRNARKHPLGNLPVAAHPPVLTARVSAVVRRVIVNQLNIADESGARVGAFDEVVTEQGVTRKPMIQHRVERGDFINAFSREDALAVEVLVGIRDCAAVDIESTLSGIDGSQARTRRRAYADADARLQDAIPFDYDAQLGIDDGLIERMSNSAHHARRGATRELRIGVESENVADLREHVEPSSLDGKGVEFADQKSVQVEKLTPFALPAHPHALAYVENAMAVEKKKPSGCRRCVPCVEFIDEASSQLDQGIGVIDMRLAYRVGKVGEQDEMQMRIAVGKKTYLEIVHQIAHLFFIEQQGGYSDQRGALAGNARAVVELWQWYWIEDGGDRIVDQVDGALHRRQQHEEESYSQPAEDRIVWQ